MFFNSLKCSTVGTRLKNPLLVFHFLCTTTNSLGFQFRSPSHQTIHLLLEKCSTMKQLKQIHGQIILNGLTKETLTTGKLISFCAVAEAGDLPYAQFIFDRIIEPNRFMFNSMIRGYSNSDDPSRAVSLYYKMFGSGISPNEFTFPFVVKACACESTYLDGMIVHGQSIKLGISLVVCVQNALINMYFLCGLIYDAVKVFDEITDRTSVSWNTMIGGYSKMGYFREAVLIFREMRQAGIEPDEFTYVSLLSVASQTCDLVLGRYIHFCFESTGKKSDLYVENALVDMYAKCGDLLTAQSIFDQMPRKNVVSWTSLLSAYSKHGLIECARKIFDQMPIKNVISWNSMISCYVQERLYGKALNLFVEMCHSEVGPDETTLIIILTSCTQFGDLVMGKKIHDYIRKIKIKHSVLLLNTLVDMYAKCGALQIALQTFLEIPEKNLVSYNVMMGAFALHGYGLKAIEVFDRMHDDGIRPDGITFTGLLSACSHSGLVDIGKHYFDRMVTFYGVPPEIEHYACMIDLLGRGGLLEEAIELMQKMEMKPDVVIWGALLGASRIRGNFQMGKIILKQLLELEPYNGGLYVLLSNIFCEARRWEDVQNIRKMMTDHGIEKGDAISCIEIGGCVYEFMVDDKKDNIPVGIYVVLDQLTGHLKSVGYTAS